MVQAAHAAHAAGARWGVPPHCHLVLFQARDKAGLSRVLDFCGQHQIDVVTFEEPDPGDGASAPMGLTAICTKPLPPEAHRLFRRFPLWRP